jgi:hypothetical protein
LNPKEVKEEVDVTWKIFVPFYFARVEGVVSGEIRFLPISVAAMVIMVATVACITPAGIISTGIGRLAGIAIVPAATKPSKTDTGRGHTRIASRVVRSTVGVLVKRVVTKDVETLLGVGHHSISSGAMRAMTPLRHAAQNKRRVSVHQRPLILEACSSYF